MKHCSECNFPLDQELTICPQCGTEVKVILPGEPTIQGSTDSDEQPKGISDTVNLSAPVSEAATEGDLESSSPSLDESSSKSSPGSGTVSAPGVRSGFTTPTGQAASADEWDDDADIDQTVDASMTELDEADDFDFDDSLPGVQSDVFSEMGDAAFGKEGGTVIAGSEDFPTVFASPDADNQRTVNAFGMPDDNQADDPHGTHVDPHHDALEPLAGQVTIDMATEDRPTYHAAMGHGTVDSTGDERKTHEEEAATEDSSADTAGTVVLPGNASAAPGGDKTVVFDSHQAASSTVEATGTSGTEGRLKRLWEGVAGSSENPMHSLQAVGLQASDSVFQRVATRRVADASTSTDISADYQIVDKLGEGAMGIVFSARQTAVNRIVAIKTAKPSFQNNDESRRRFLYEAHITADLDHSNIVPIHELGASEEGMLFYSMKLVQGTEWSRVMRKKTREQNLEIFMKVTDAMAFAHSKGVIHRDLKPENTMLGRFGEVFVTDWGTAINLDKDTTHLAKPAAKGDKFLTLEDASNFVRGDSLVLHDGFDTYDRAQIVNFDEANPNRIYLRKKLTRDYQPSRRLYVVKAMNLAGTPCYMAPEMAGHQLPKIAKTSDIYILGAILYDLVTGKPPHTGDSVTQCLRAALKNEIIRTDTEDALLAIAYKAMATEPAERYQSVEELQEAVREYSRHAESIALSDRSDELLKVAIVKKDYETFSRTMFGYRDAIELWPDNKAAAIGLKQARLAFGKAAFAKGDYDLVLQTLDRNEVEEAQLYSQAVKAKKKFEEREATLKLLKRVVAAVVLFAVVGLSGLAWFANNQKNIAVAAKDSAEKSAEQERQAKSLEAEARKAAETSAEEARIAEDKAVREKAIADEEREKAKVLAQSEAEQRMKAEENKVKANEETKKAIAAQAKAEEQEQLAKRRSAQIQLGEYNSSLALAKSQIESNDLAAGAENLGKLQSMFASATEQADADANSNDVFFGNAPRIDTWGWKRIQLLGNLDLPKATLSGAGDPNTVNIDAQVIDSQVTAAAFAPTAGLAVVGTRQGLVQVLQYEAGELRKSRSLLESGARIDALAVSPNGQEVVYAFTQGDVSGVKRWEVAQDTAQEVVATQKRSFQRFAYTPGGQQLVGGISGGIWLWDLTDDWYQRENPTERISIRGELTNLQGLDPQHSLLTTRFVERGQPTVLIGILDHQSKVIDLVKTNDQLAARLSSAAHTLIDNHIVLGLSDNRVMMGTLDPTTREITDLVELEDKHLAPVTHVVSNGSNQLLTASNSEPVAHVWRFNPQLRAWEYDTYLTGTPRNIAGVGLLGDRILAVDAGGTSIVWDVQRQKQRRRLERVTDNEFVEYTTPVQAVIAGPSDGHAIAIDTQGVVDLWSLSNGQTRRVDNARWGYFGHTPGARLVNSAIDLERGVVVTAASLQNALKQYLSQPDHAWEFCVWNANSGEMLQRWTAPNRRIDERIETIEQRISLVDGGRQILFASDSETRLVELNTGRETFLRNDFGSYFAVPNPRNPGLLMLVKRSGAVRLLDLREPASWEKTGMRNFGLADPSDIPLDGIWSEDGKQFFMTFSTGSLAAFTWNGSQLELSWSTRKLNGVASAARISQALQTDSGRVQSHLDVDLAVQSQPNGHVLYIATRRRGLSPTTQLTVLRFSDSQSTPELVRSEKQPQVQWLQARGVEAPQLTARLHDVLVVDANRVRSRQRINDQTFVSTSGAQVLGLTDGQPEVMSYGRSRLISATGTKDGGRLMVLLEDGALWQFTAEGTAGQWSRMDYSALGASRIVLSPLGDQLLIVQPAGGTLVETASGTQVAQVGELTAAAWDPGAAHRLAVGRSNGSVELIVEGIVEPVGQKPLLAEGATWVSLNFFSEVWADSRKQARQFLLVQSEADNKGALQFVPLDPAPANAADAQPEVEVIPVGSRVAVSPTDNIIVTGAPGGTVSVWFAAPTHDRKPKQLFDLEGHRGEDITCLTFSSDGRTIVTADSKNRLYAWLSQDPLVRK